MFWVSFAHTRCSPVLLLLCYRAVTSGVYYQVLATVSLECPMFVPDARAAGTTVADESHVRQTRSTRHLSPEHDKRSPHQSVDAVAVDYSRLSTAAPLILSEW
ncbi:hypothetical protein RB195_009901 [Necator americanus]|uniref:Secreted protein n=1 Tax=Necator americanus TaxID=51031 RepID=A0ABR1CW87_NECAM